MPVGFFFFLLIDWLYIPIGVNLSSNTLEVSIKMKYYNSSKGPYLFLTNAFQDTTIFFQIFSSLQFVFAQPSSINRRHGRRRPQELTIKANESTECYFSSCQLSLKISSEHKCTFIDTGQNENTNTSLYGRSQIVRSKVLAGNTQRCQIIF